MSSPSSELTWLSSDEIDALLEEVDLEEIFPEQQPSWPNTWSPVNHWNKTGAVNSLTPPPFQHDTETDELSSASASCHRDAILASADRMYETKTARKRKSLMTSPQSARKRRAVTVNREEAAKPIALLDGEISPSKKPPAPRKPKPVQSQLTDSLMPIRSSRLNTASTAEKRTASEALPSDTVTWPEKRIFTTRHRFIPPEQSKSGLAKGITDTIRQVKSDNSMKHNSETENFMPLDYKEEDDLFDDGDDAIIEAFFEAEKTLVAETVIASTKFAVSPDSTKPASEKVTSPSIAHPKKCSPSPMTPFLRPFVPLASSSDTSPAGSIVSPLHRSPTCFRIAEALRYISSTYSTGTTIIKALNLEVYAYLHNNVESGGVSTITLADIFFPGKPPYLNATVKRTTTILSQNGESASSLLLDSLRACLVRVVVQVTSSPSINQPTTAPAATPSPLTSSNFLARKCTVTALKIEETEWNEIQRVKDILEEKSSSENMSPGKPNPHAQNGTSGSSGQKSPQSLFASPDSTGLINPAPMSMKMAELSRNGHRQLPSCSGNR